jgi:hypothetical protein
LCHRLLIDARFCALQMKFDVDLAEQVREAGCPECGGRLDSARYPRKSRGATGALPDEYSWRLSFCCSTRGCRRRNTPPSIRFLGRRVYLGAVVVLATAMQQGVTPTRARRLHEVFGVSLRTLARWREWWRTTFAESAFWKAGKGFFSPSVDAANAPRALLERFGLNEEPQLLALLRFLAPISTPAGYLPDQRF